LVRLRHDYKVTEVDSEVEFEVNVECECKGYIQRVMQLIA